MERIDLINDMYLAAVAWWNTTQDPYWLDSAINLLEILNKERDM